MSTFDRYADVRSLGDYLRRNEKRTRKSNAAYARRELDSIMDDLNEHGAFGQIELLVREMRSDGFSDAAFHAIQALPLLKQAETHLGRAKGKLA